MNRLELVADLAGKVVQAISLISQGHTQTRACETAGLSVRAFRAFLDRHPDMKDELRMAENIGYDIMADELLNIDNSRLYGNSDDKMAKTVSDNIKWFLSRKRPSSYGDKVHHVHELTADRAILDALEAGKQRALTGVVTISPVPQTDAIDAPYTEVPATPPTPTPDEDAGELNYLLYGSHVPPGH